MHRNLINLFLWLAVLSLLSPVSGYGTTIRRFTFDELCAQAPVIIVGRCTAVSIEQDAQSGAVHTRYVFAVEDLLKGSAAQRQVTVRMPGGRLGGVSTMVHGMPKFQENEPVVLFLTEPGRAGFPWVMGLGQGCYRIYTDPATGASMVRRDPADGSLYDGTTADLRKPAAAGGPEALERFKQRIRETVQHPASKREL